MIVRKLILIAAIAALTTGTAQSSATELSVSLPDQYGDTMSLDDFAAEPVLAILTSTRKLRWVGRWEAALRKELPELVSLRVADVVDEPPPDVETVATMLRRRVPENVRVLIDIDNVWATHYEIDTTEPCLLLFDGDHNLVASFRGRPRGPLVEDVLMAIRDYFPPTGD